MFITNFTLYNTLDSILSNLGLNRTVLYVWTYEEFLANRHLIAGKAGSYGLYNTLKGMFYIGSAVDLYARLMHNLRYANPRN